MIDGDTIRIVSWSTEHIWWLRPAISAFFQAGVARGGDLLDTRRNVDTYLKLGLEGASRGDPCLLAVVEDVPVAFVLWVGQPDVVDSRYRTVNAIGSYTDPAFRSKRLATELRHAALRISREKGYERVVGPVHNTNERGIYEFCVNYGAWPMSTNFEFAL